MPVPLRLYPTEAAAKKAGLALADFRGERLSTVLYALLPEDEKKPIYRLCCLNWRHGRLRAGVV